MTPPRKIPAAAVKWRHAAFLRATLSGTFVASLHDRASNLRLVLLFVGRVVGDDAGRHQLNNRRTVWIR
jgi:hypothetical protein